MKEYLKLRARQILKTLTVDGSRIESPLLFQPNLNNHKPPKVVRPSPAIQQIIQAHAALTKR